MYLCKVEPVYFGGYILLTNRKKNIEKIYNDLYKYAKKY